MVIEIVVTKLDISSGNNNVDLNLCVLAGLEKSSGSIKSILLLLFGQQSEKI